MQGPEVSALQQLVAVCVHSVRCGGTKRAERVAQHIALTKRSCAHAEPVAKSEQPHE